MARYQSRSKKFLFPVARSHVWMGKGEPAPETRKNAPAERGGKGEARGRPDGVQMAANATMREFFGTFPPHMTSLALFAFLVSLVATLLVRRLALRWHTPYAQDASQRLHVGYVPRLGGLGVFAGWAGMLMGLRPRGAAAAPAAGHGGQY